MMSTEQSKFFDGMSVWCGRYSEVVVSCHVADTVCWAVGRSWQSRCGSSPCQVSGRRVVSVSAVYSSWWRPSYPTLTTSTVTSAMWRWQCARTRERQAVTGCVTSHTRWVSTHLSPCTPRECQHLCHLAHQVSVNTPVTLHTTWVSTHMSPCMPCECQHTYHLTHQVSVNTPVTLRTRWVSAHLSTRTPGVSTHLLPHTPDECQHTCHLAHQVIVKVKKKLTV